MKLKKSEYMSLWHYILECGECVEGGRIKQDMCYASTVLDVTAELAEDELDDDRELAVVLAMFVGKRLSIEGYTTYYEGFETHDDWISVLEEATVTRVETIWVPAQGPTLDPERKLLDVTVPAMSTAKEVL